MNETTEHINKLTEIIDRLPPGRMRSDYSKKRDVLIAIARERKEESERISALVDIAKQMRVDCFMCKEVVEKFDQNEPLSDGNKYHIQAHIPAVVRLREFRGKVLVSIELLINHIF